MSGIVRIKDLDTAEELTSGDYLAVDSAGEGLRKVPLKPITDDISDLKNQLTHNKEDDELLIERQVNGHYTPRLEVGNISLSGTDLVYGTYKYRVRTPQDGNVKLKSGDVLRLSTYTNARFMLYYNNNGSWVGLGWKSADYTIVNDGEYALMLAKVTEDTSAVYTKPSDIGFTIDIIDNHSIKKEINDLASVLTSSDLMTNGFYLSVGRLYWRIGKISVLGTFRCTQIPPSTRVGVQGYSDDTYATKVYDTGWKTAAPFTVDLEDDVYYQVVIANYDYSLITSVTVGDDYKMYHDYNIDDEIKGNDDAVNERFESYMLLQSDTVKSIAHRGDFDTAPQCTKPAYVLARKRGFRYAENDVNITLDGKYAMWHDTTLTKLGNLVDVNGYLIYTDGDVFYYYDDDADKLYTYTTEYVESLVDVSTLTRCAGEDYSVSGLTLAVLKRIDFGVYKGAEYQGTQILTFAEWILLCKQLGMNCYIDSKITYTEQRVADLVGIVKWLGMLRNVTWVNINTTTVADYIRALDPKSRLGILSNPTNELVTTFADYNVGGGFFFNGNAKVITQEEVTLGLEAGFEVEAYYVEYVGQSEGTILERIRGFVNMGLSGMTLDAYRVENAFQSMIQ